MRVRICSLREAFSNCTQFVMQNFLNPFLPPTQWHSLLSGQFILFGQRPPPNNKCVFASRRGNFVLLGENYVLSSQFLGQFNFALVCDAFSVSRTAPYKEIVVYPFWLGRKAFFFVSISFIFCGVAVWRDRRDERVRQPRRSPCRQCVRQGKAKNKDMKVVEKKCFQQISSNEKTFWQRQKTERTCRLLQFKYEEDAEKAVADLNNRWFNGRPIHAELSPVTDFRSVDEAAHYPTASYPSKTGKTNAFCIKKKAHSHLTRRLRRKCK